MVRIVADTSALISLGTVADTTPNPLDLLLDAHDVILPKQVVDELTETASYDDASSQAAQTVLDRQDAFDVRSIELDETFPLGHGENARSHWPMTSMPSNCSVTSSTDSRWCMRHWRIHGS